MPSLDLILGVLLIVIGHHARQKRCFTTSVWKIRFLKTICCG